MRSLTLKLTLAFLTVSLTGVALVALLIWSITATEFNQFLVDRGLSEYSSMVTDYYATHGSWDGVENALHERGLVDSPNNVHDGKNPPPPPFALVDQHGIIVVGLGTLHKGDPVPADWTTKAAALTVDNQEIGAIYATGGAPSRGTLESRFIERTNQALLLAALGAVTIAVLLGLFLARTITRPIRELTAASSAMAQGRLIQEVPVRSKDELGELTRAFNKMSFDLARANQLRKQMTADIAHDLRSPLAVITGYLEGLKDGVLKPTPKRFAAMFDEAMYLQRLIEDLRTLSLADAGELSMNLQPVQTADLVERAAASFQHQAEQSQIGLQTTVSADLPMLRVDPERMQQALANLVGNALRYTPPGGQIALSAQRKDAWIQIDIRDTGRGISPEDLPHVFERFYRGDSSRHENGSGLGLAITKSIIELQGGKIAAASSGPGSGSQFSISLPIPAP